MLERGLPLAEIAGAYGLWVDAFGTALESGKIALDVGPFEIFDQHITDRLEFAEQQRVRKSVAADRAVALDHDDLALGVQRRPHPPQEGIGLRHFVIHVHKEDAVKTVCRQLRIVSLAQLDRNVFRAARAPPVGQDVRALRG